MCPAATRAEAEVISLAKIKLAFSGLCFSFMWPSVLPAEACYSSGSAHHSGWSRQGRTGTPPSWSRCRRFLRWRTPGSSGRTLPTPCRVPPAAGCCCSGTWCCSWSCRRRTDPGGAPRGSGKRWAPRGGSTGAGTSHRSWTGEQEIHERGVGGGKRKKNGKRSKIWAGNTGGTSRHFNIWTPNLQSWQELSFHFPSDRDGKLPISSFPLLSKYLLYLS